MPGWIVRVRETFCKQMVILVGFLPGFVSLVLFTEFHLIHFGFQVFYHEKLKNVIEDPRF